MSVLLSLLGFLVLLSNKKYPFYRKLLSVNGPGQFRQWCDHSLDKRRILSGHGDFSLYDGIKCSGNRRVISHPIDPYRVQFVRVVTEKSFVS